MVWFLVLIMIISIVLLVVKWNNFYGLTFALGFLAIEMLILVIILSASKFATYPHQTQLEYRIYHEILRIKLNYFDLKRIVNFSVWFFSGIMIAIAWKNSAMFHMGKNLLAYGLFFVLDSLWILALDSVKMHEILYIAVHTGRGGMELLKTVIQRGELLLLLACCILPLWKIQLLIRSTRLRVRKRYLSAILISTGVLIAVFLCMVLSAPLKYYLWYYEANSFQNLYGFYRTSRLISEFIWLFLFIIVIILLLARFNILKQKNFIKKKWSYRNSVIRINDLRHIFHSYKNAMFSVECMCDVVLKEYGKPESEQAAREILACVRSYREQVGKFLNVYNRADMKWSRFQMQEAVREAERRVGYAKGIRITVNTETEDDFIYGDFEAVVEMFVNLINNSREALAGIEDREREIRVHIWTESTLACVSVRDNGEGMDKKVLRNLYTPFFTTKKNFQNWGIGMSQIRKTVDLHQGFIDVESRPGKYTEFQIAVPLDM